MMTVEPHSRRNAEILIQSKSTKLDLQKNAIVHLPFYRRITKNDGIAYLFILTIVESPTTKELQEN